MINGIVCPEGLTEGKGKNFENTLLLHATQAFRALHKGKWKLTQGPHNFPEEMSEFTPGLAEKVAVRADIFTQAKAFHCTEDKKA